MEEKVLIYTNSYRETINNQEKFPFRIIDYAELCKERERKSRYREAREISYYRPLQYSTGNERNFYQNFRKSAELGDN